MIDRETTEKVSAVIHKHAATITLDFLLDLTRALGLTLSVKVIDKTEEPANPPKRSRERRIAG